MKQTFQIQGMYCPNCEKRITSALRKLEGVTGVRVDYASGRAEIESKKALDREALRALIADLGYELSDNAGGLSQAASLLVIILGLSVILDRLSLLNRLVPSQLGDSSMSYALFFLTGLLTSVHCVAMCGGICLSQSLPGKGRWASVFYNTGRVISYSLIGGTLGLIGSLLAGRGLTISPVLQGGIKLLAGSGMLVAGVNLLGLFPALRRLQLRLPGLPVTSRAPFVIGLLNGLMPCGPLQAMRLAALGSGSALWGALSMLFFSLGTVPLMLAFGTAAAAFGKRFTRLANLAGGILVAIFGIAMLTQGSALTGMIRTRQIWAFLLGLAVLFLISLLPIRKTLRQGLGALSLILLVFALAWKSSSPVEPADTVRIENGVQLVDSVLESGRYPDITVQVGMPVHWTIYAEEGVINGCNAAMIIPGLDLSLRFQPGENTLDFTPETSGTIPYSCWMGMIRANITVLD